MSKRIHFIGICGTAMATLAAMLKARGHDVQGSDHGVYPPMSDFLAREQIRVFDAYREEQITGDLDLVVNNLNAVCGVYRNDGAAPRVAVRLKGRSPNTEGIGAKVALLGGVGCIICLPTFRLTFPTLSTRTGTGRWRVPRTIPFRPHRPV